VSVSRNHSLSRMAGVEEECKATSLNCSDSGYPFVITYFCSKCGEKMDSGYPFEWRTADGWTVVITYFCSKCGEKMVYEWSAKHQVTPLNCSDSGYPFEWRQQQTASRSLR
jgi:DNA-directed RNA polymerase subunit RPC12/RpoP